MKQCFSKILLLVALFGVWAKPSHAQDVVYSPYEKFDFRSGEFSVIGKVGDRLYVYRGSSEGYYMDAYNSNMQRLATVVLDFLPRKVFGTKFITYPDKMLVLYQVSEGSNVVQYGTILDHTGRILKKPQKLDEVKASFLGGRSGLYAYAVSKSKQNILIYGAGAKGNTVNIRTVWIDNELNKRSVKNAEFEADNNVEFGEGVSTESGSFFLPVYTPLGPKGFADRLWMLSLKQGDSKLENVELPLNDLYASGTYMQLDEDANRIYVGGFYSDKKNGNFEGILYTYFDITGNQFVNVKTIPFGEELRTATGDRNKKRAFNDYQVKELIVRNDGGFVLVAEDFFITTRNSYSQGFGYYSWYYPTMAASVREYNYGDILLMSYDGDGRQEWVRFIRKTQYSQEDGGLFSSYSLVNTGGELGFLFNDFNMSRSRIQIASADAQGNVNINSLKFPRGDDSPPDWLPRSGKQVSANEYVVPCLKRNQICFAKVVF